MERIEDEVMEQARLMLKKVFGYDQFRQGQDKIVHSLLNGQDTLGILPTGGGKSIGYQLPALLLEGTTLVISPLISLMKDQVDALAHQGVSATFINSSLSGKETADRLQRLSRDQYKIVYAAPERLETETFRQTLQALRIPLIAVDEAHCISQWGHDFRPSYRQIPALIEALPRRPVIGAFTATATDKVVKDIQAHLQLHRPTLIRTGYARGNLSFTVEKGVDKDQYILDFVRQRKGQTGIIYAATRKEVEQQHARLKARGIPAGRYHAGLSEKERSVNQEDFLHDRLEVMVATNAFGMGIDKSDVRYVIHHNLPKNIESYYQEAGRAGRDGEPAECILLFAPQDIVTQKFLIGQSTEDQERQAADLRQLQTMIHYSRTDGCLQKYIVRYFGDTTYDRCGICANCTDDRERRNVTLEAQQIFSCVKRMGERFGVTLTAKVLKGSADQKIRQFRFDQLSTYGLMRQVREKDITELINGFIADGYLKLTDSRYPTLSLDRSAVAVLKGEAEAWRKEAIVRRREQRVNEALFEQLRTLRKQMAEERSVPPYTIFHDATLREMCETMPQDEQAMLRIRGMGETKYRKYGERFLEAIRNYA